MSGGPNDAGGPADPAEVDALIEIGQYVDWPDEPSGAATERLLGGSDDAGTLTRLARWVAAVQWHSPPQPLERVRLVLAGVDEAEPSVLVTAERHGVAVDPVAVPAQPHASAVAAGAAYVDAAVESGLDALLVARPVAGFPASAATLVSVLVEVEPVKVVDSRLPTEEWVAAVTAVRDARRTAMPLRREPHRLLARVGTPTDAWTAGALLRAAQRRTPTIIDGLPALAAAVLADATVPQAHRWWQLADSGPAPAHRLAADRLGLPPVLDFRTGDGDGTAAVLALAAVRAAVDRARAPRNVG